MSIKAIETRYAGCRFRSRLEARWAVFFDTLGIAWEYEPQGFELPPYDTCQGDLHYLDAPGPCECLQNLGYYLPDFWLPKQDIWFEVKGAEPPDEYIGFRHPSVSCLDYARVNRFACLQGKRLILAIGAHPDPRLIKSQGFSSSKFDLQAIMPGWDNHYAWCRCPFCGSFDIQYEGRADRNHCGCREDPKINIGDHPAILRAYTAARSARFEHGERG